MSTFGKIAVVLLLTVGAFLGGTLATRHPARAASANSTRQILYYHCPMHPQYKSDRPGTAPCCGMRLEPVHAGEESATENVAPGFPGAVQVNAAKQQLIGVRTDVVERTSGSNLLRVPGRITADDTRVYRIVAAADGWIRQMGRNPAGAFVRENQVLASYYVRELLLTEQNYLNSVQSSGQSGQTQGNVAAQRNSYLQLGADALRGFGMTDSQIEELERTRQVRSEIRVDSPVTGFVLARNVSPGQRFEKGTELYRIADISHVWVMTDIFEKDWEFLTPGTVATVRYRGRDFHARMSDLLPQFDPQSRTMKSRFELDNPDFVLRPDMFVDVEVRVNVPAAITVPADAVIDSGRRKTVYVARGDDLFEPRLVKTGWRSGDRVQITEGLASGERIVVSGNFLIDSESRMKLPAAIAEVPMADASTGKDPVCGMRVDAKAANATQTQYRGRTYTLCSPKCRKDFEAAPEKYVNQPAADLSGTGGME